MTLSIKMLIVDVIRKIKFNYLILSTYEAGIVLESWEIKGVKKFGFDILGSYIAFDKLNCFLYNSYIKSVRSHFYKDEFTERRNRLLLLRRREITLLYGMVKLSRYTIVPIKAYWKSNIIKLSIALCIGKKKYDKREKIKKAEWVSARNKLDF